MEEEFAEEGVSGGEHSPSNSSGGVWGMGRLPGPGMLGQRASSWAQAARSRPAVSMTPLWSSALGLCSVETPNPGGNAAADSRFQSPGPGSTGPGLEETRARVIA